MGCGAGLIPGDGEEFSGNICAETNIWAQGELRRLHNKGFHSLYRSPNVVRIKYRKLISAGHVARMEEGRSAVKILTDKSTGKKLCEGLGVDEMAILEYISNK